MSASVGPNATVTPAGGAMASSFSSSNVVAEARKYLGGNPTGRGSLWCARFMNMVLQHSGYRGTGSDMANSFAKYGQRVSGPQVGAIAVMTRGRRGGHVGIITGIDAKGNPIMISGNNGNRVREAPVSRGRIYAYVMPIELIDSVQDSVGWAKRSVPTIHTGTLFERWARFALPTLRRCRLLRACAPPKRTCFDSNLRCAWPRRRRKMRASGRPGDGRQCRD